MDSKMQLLWSGFRNGEEKAFSEMYSLYVDNLFSYGMKICHNRELVQDSIQDVYIDLYESRKRINEPQNLLYYLIKSLKHRLFKKIKIESKYTAEDLVVFSEFKTEYGVESKMIGEELESDKVQLIKQALKELTEKQQEILYLRFTMEFGYDEISKIVGIDHNSVRKQVYRSIKKLRNCNVGQNYKSLLLFLSFVKPTI